MSGLLLRVTRQHRAEWLVLCLCALIGGCGDNSSSAGSAGRVVYSVSGTVSYPQTLTNPGNAVLQLNTSTKQAQPGETWEFDGLLDGEAYTLSIQSSPSLETCSIAGSSGPVKSVTGTVNGADVLNVVINCVPNQYTVSATVSGLPSAIQLPKNSTFNNYTVLLHLTSSSTTFAGAETDAKLGLIGNQTTPVAFAAAGSNVPISIDDGSDFQVTVEEPSVRNSEVCSNSELSSTVQLRPLNCVVINSPTLGRINASNVQVSVVCKPIGRFLYATMDNELPPNSPPNAPPPQGSVVPFSISPTTGALTAGTVVAADIDPGALAIAQPHPPIDTSCPVAGSESYAYLSNVRVNSMSQYDVSQYSIDNTTGAITPLNPATVPVASGKQPFKFAPSVDPSNTHVYVTDSNGVNVSSYTIEADGTLLSSTVYGGNTNAYGGVVFSPNGSFAYQVSEKGRVLSPTSATNPYVTAYDFQSGGTLSEIDQTFTDIEEPLFLSFEPKGRFAYLLAYTSCAANTSCPSTSPAGVLSFQVGSDGKLNAVGGTTVSQDVGVSGSSSAYAPLVLDNTGTYAFVLNHAASSISAYQINADGTLCSAVGSPFQPGGYTFSPYNIVIDPSGKFLYVLFSETSTIAAYSINLTSYVPNLTATSGCSTTSGAPALSLIGVYLTGDLTQQGVMAIDQSGSYLYVGNVTNGGEAAIADPHASVSAFFIDPNSGALTPVLGSPFATPSGTTFIYTITALP
jgi:6-phosphogluconolactonase (cycloisomerase 2 family)